MWIAKRQVAVLQELLSREDFVNLEDLMTLIEKNHYAELASSGKAFIRDLNQLVRLGAIDVESTGKPLPGRGFYSQYSVKARLSWPMEITETKFYEQINKMPQAKTRLLLASW
jgi:hypothetical protein